MGVANGGAVGVIGAVWERSKQRLDQHGAMRRCTNTMYRTRRCWELLAALGGHVREARRRRALDQYDLAEALGVHRSTISKIEAGKHWPGAALFERLADYFGVEPPELFVIPRMASLPVRDALIRERAMVKANGFTLEMRMLDKSLAQIDSPATQACAVVIAGRAATIHPGGREILGASEVLFFTPSDDPVYAQAADPGGAALLVIHYGASAAPGPAATAAEGAAMTDALSE